MFVFYLQLPHIHTETVNVQLVYVGLAQARPNK